MLGRLGQLGTLGQLGGGSRRSGIDAEPEVPDGAVCSDEYVVVTELNGIQYYITTQVE